MVRRSSHDRIARFYSERCATKKKKHAGKKNGKKPEAGHTRSRRRRSVMMKQEHAERGMREGDGTGIETHAHTHVFRSARIHYASHLQQDARKKNPQTHIKTWIRDTIF